MAAHYHATRRGGHFNATRSPTFSKVLRIDRMVSHGPGRASVFSLESFAKSGYHRSKKTTKPDDRQEAEDNADRLSIHSA